MTLTRGQNDDPTFFDDITLLVETYPSTDPTSELVVLVEPSATPVSDDSISFVTPPSNQTRYHRVILMRGGALVASFPSLLTYVEHDCFNPGFVWYQRACRPCAEFKGAFCPGGTRFWPRKGFWSPSESVPPGDCDLEQSCPGALGEVEGYPARADGEGRRKTDQCADGYADEYCSVCDDGYFSDLGVCRGCGSDSAANAELVLVSIVFLGIAVVLLVAIFFLSTQHLVSVCAVVVAVQQAVLAARIGLQQVAANSSSNSYATLLRILSIVNFEIELFKPGCSVPRISFLSLYYGTLTIVAMAAILFVLTVAARSYVHPNARFVAYVVPRDRREARRTRRTRRARGGKKTRRPQREEEQEEQEEQEEEEERESWSSSGLSSASSEVSLSSASSEVSLSSEGSSTGQMSQEERMTVLMARTKHALIILGAVAYLQLTLRTLQVLHCVKVGDGSTRLAIERRVHCYTGDHLFATLVAVVVAAGACIGLPLWGAVVAIRAGRWVRDGQMRRVGLIFESYGFLLRGLRPRFLWFRSLQVAVTLVFVVQAVFIPSGKGRVFSISIHFGVSVLLVGMLDPFVERWHSLLAICAGAVSGGQILYALSQEDDMTLFGLGTSAQVMCVSVAMLAIILQALRSKRRSDVVEDVSDSEASEVSEGVMMMSTLLESGGGDEGGGDDEEEEEKKKGMDSSIDMLLQSIPFDIHDSFGRASYDTESHAGDPLFASLDARIHRSLGVVLDMGEDDEGEDELGLELARGRGRRRVRGSGRTGMVSLAEAQRGPSGQSVPQILVSPTAPDLRAIAQPSSDQRRSMSRLESRRDEIKTPAPPGLEELSMLLSKSGKPEDYFSDKPPGSVATKFRRGRKGPGKGRSKSGQFEQRARHRRRSSGRRRSPSIGGGVVVIRPGGSGPSGVSSGMMSSGVESSGVESSGVSSGLSTPRRSTLALVSPTRSTFASHHHGRRKHQHQHQHQNQRKRSGSLKVLQQQQQQSPRSRVGGGGGKDLDLVRGRRRKRADSNVSIH